MSCAEEQEQNQSHSKSGKRDGNGLVRCCMPPAALPRVALRGIPDGRRKRGRPKETWREDSGERDEGEQLDMGVTWNDEHPTEANGILWPRSYVFKTRRGLSSK